MFLIIILYMLFASTFTIGKAALVYTTPIFFIGTRMLIGGVLLLVYQYFFNKKHWRLSRDDIGLLAQISFFQYFAAFVLEFWALQWISSGKTALIWNLSPFITAIISFIILGEIFTKKKFLGLIVGFVGFLPILMTSAPSEKVPGSFLWFSLPEFVLLGAVVCASYGWIVLKKAQDRGYTTVMINSLTMTAAGIAAFITSFIVEGAPQIIPPTSCYATKIPSLCNLFGPYWASVALFVFYTAALIVIANVICFNLYGYLLNFYSTTFLSFAGFITPLFAAFFGWIFLGEKIGLPFMVTVVIVFCGLMLFYQEELKLRP